MMNEPLPASFDPAVYASHPRNADLAGFTEAHARQHHALFGQREGRVASAVDGRASFVRLASQDSPILEIGPFCTPAFTRPDQDVAYLDALSTEALQARAATLDGADPNRVPEIDFVWSGQRYLALTGRVFATVFSSHAIEHQPCLISHLQDVSSVLKPGGRYFAIVPDKRYCFDHYTPESSIADVLDAFAAGRRTHTARSILIDKLLHTHNDPKLHWRGDHGPDPYRLRVADKRVSMIAGVLAEIGKQKGYIDAHAWQFTPDDFCYIIDALNATAMTDLKLERVYPTMLNSLEFYAVLSKPSER